MVERSSRGVYREFSAGSFLWRLGASLVLVLATYNPSAFSYYRWLASGFANNSLGPEHFVVGILLIAGWAVLIVATRNSLGIGGLLLVAAFIGGVVWWLASIGVSVAGSMAALSWVTLICLSVLLAVGLSWSHIWRRLTGQVEVDDDKP
jgi:Family of unknown function (DUF6524)